MKTYEKVYNIVKKIPKGKVATYGQIAQILDLNPRVVGWALNRLAHYRAPTCEKRPAKKHLNRKFHPSGRSSRLAALIYIPWQRVINSKGGISTNKLMNIPIGLQKKLLEKEGIEFNRHGKTNLKKYLWRF